MRVLRLLAIVLAVSYAPAESACFDLPGNWVPACGFESPGEVAQWNIDEGTGAFTPNPVRSGVGAVSVLSEDVGGSQVSQVSSNCFPMETNTEHGWGVFVYVESNSLGVSCSVSTTRCEVPDCASTCATSFQVPVEIQPLTWTNVWSGDLYPDQGEISATITFRCESVAPFQVVFDDAFLGDELVPVILQSFVVQ